MTVMPGAVEPSGSAHEKTLACLLLVLFVWFGNFLDFNKFSLYVDDLTFLGRALQVPNWFDNYLANMISYSDGRPIQYALICLTGQIISKTGSFGPAYIFLFVVTAASIVATWWALTYRFSNAVAFIAASVLALSPLVSVRPFLNGIASPAALLFLMLAGVLYVSGWRVLSYAVSGLILLSYELTFPIFVLLPVLLKPMRTRRDLYGFAGHAVICAALLVAYTVFKDHYGAGRLQSAMAGHNPIALGAGVAGASFRSVVYGVSGSLDLPLWLGRIALTADTIIWAVLAFVVFAYLLHRLPSRQAGLQSDRSLVLQTIGVLLLMALAGYALVYFANPEGARGVLDRDSRFHSVANLPLSILTAMLLGEALAISQRVWLRGAVIAIEATYLALIFAFSVSHQDDFARETERQRLLVTQLVMDHPMMDPQATFVVQMPATDWRRFSSIEYNDNHSFYFLLPDLFDFSRGTGQRVGPDIRIVLGDSWPQLMTPGEGDQLNWPSWMWPPKPEHVGHIWAYDFSADGRLTPVPGPVAVGGRNILHDGPDAADGALDLRTAKRLPLFDVFMGPDVAIVDAALKDR
jgi:hypothetical protein